MNLPDFSYSWPRAVVLDLDGTTLDSTSAMAERTGSAIRALAKTRLPVIIATARPARVLPKLVGVETLDLCSIVQMNGTLAEGRPPLGGSVSNPMPSDQAEKCWSITVKMAPDVRMTMELDGHRFAINHFDDVAALWNLNTATPNMVIPVEEVLAAGPSKVSINGLGNHLGELRTVLKKTLAPEIDVIPADADTFINVVHRSASKEGSVTALLASIGIELGDVMAFGDDFPDIGMLTHAGWPVAVANAIPEVKALAKFETASNDDHGVAMVLEQLLRALGGRE